MIATHERGSFVPARPTRRATLRESLPGTAMAANRVGGFDSPPPGLPAGNTATCSAPPACQSPPGSIRREFGPLFMAKHAPKFLEVSC
jgi:hypothetical protein